MDLPFARGIESSASPGQGPRQRSDVGVKLLSHSPSKEHEALKPSAGPVPLPTGKNANESSIKPGADSLCAKTEFPHPWNRG